VGQHSLIEWTDDTWNPLRGCSRVSEGCRNCYAERTAIRQVRSRYAGLVKSTPNGPRWTGEVGFVEEVLKHPLRWKSPRKIFVNSMSDLYHEKVTDEWRHRIYAVMEQASRHTFQILTKRPERMQTYLAERYGETRIPPRHIWHGVSVENQAAVDERIPRLLETPAAVRFLSIEPLLGPISDLPLDGIHWVIVGGESGPRHRPVQADWVRDIRDQCARAGVAFFFKQWGGRTPKAGGRVLDGVEWSEFPSRPA
jgi:protein gp37